MERYPTYDKWGRRYLAAVFDGQRRDTSFAVLEGEQPILLAACAAGAGALDYWGLPIHIFVHERLTESEKARAIALAFSHLESLLAHHQVSRLVLQDELIGSELSLLGEQCHRRDLTAAVSFSGLCDVSKGEAGMRVGLRKSFRSLINWGRRNLKVVCLNKANPDRALFQRYQDFHFAVAGRSTRPQTSWDIMYDWIVDGHGEIVFGWLSDDLVAGTVVLDGTEVAVYASGVYDRAHFDKPIAHWPLWLAMLNAAERGVGIFDLGDLPVKGTVTDKEYSIGYFKRGFATRIRARVQWMSGPMKSDALRDVLQGELA
jgi:hypothetical protein